MSIEIFVLLYALGSFMTFIIGMLRIEEVPENLDFHEVILIIIFWLPYFLVKWFIIPSYSAISNPDQFLIKQVIKATNQDEVYWSSGDKVNYRCEYISAGINLNLITKEVSVNNRRTLEITRRLKTKLLKAFFDQLTRQTVK